MPLSLINFDVLKNDILHNNEWESFFISLFMLCKNCTWNDLFDLNILSIIQFEWYGTQLHCATHKPSIHYCKILLYKGLDCWNLFRISKLMNFTIN